MKRWTGFCIAMLGAILLGLRGTTPPAPLGGDAPVATFSASRAMADVAVIAARPHATGTPENAQVRAYIAARLRTMGLEVREAPAPLPPASTERLRRWSKGRHAPGELVNLIGVLPGRDRSLPAVALMAHHDTVWGSPGAADDTAGVATILETVRAIRTRGQPLRDIAVIITDAEEIGLAGAEAFFAGDPLRQRIGTIINLEARGGGGRTSMFETSPGNGEAISVYAGAVGRPGATSLAVFIYRLLPNDTDMSVALRGQWPGFNFAFIGRPGLYHSPLATPGRLDKGALQDMGAQVLALADALARAPALPQRAPDRVFFDLFGFVLVLYPVWFGWCLAGAMALALGWAMRRDCPRAPVLAGAGRMLALVAGGGLVLLALNRASGAGPGAEYYDRLAAIPKLEAMAALACCGLLALFLAHPADRPARTGGALLLAAIGLAAQALAPTAAYVVVVPVLLAALVLCLEDRPARIAAVAFAALVVGYQIYLGHFVMQGVGPTMPFVLALPLALVALALQPLWPGIERRRARQGGAVLLGLALAMALWVRLDPVADSVAVYAGDSAVEAIPATKPRG